MPVSLTIDLPIIVAGRPPVVTAAPVCTGEPVATGGNVATATRRVVRQFQRMAKTASAEQLGRWIVPGEVAIRSASVVIEPPPRQTGWRSPVTLTLDVVAWPIDDRTHVAWLPGLDLRIVHPAKQSGAEEFAEEFAELIDRRVRAELRRREVRSLESLAALPPLAGYRLVDRTVELTLPTAAQSWRMADDDDEPSVMRSVATRLLAKRMPVAIGRDALVDRLDRLITAERPQSVVLVGRPGVGKTAIWQHWVGQRSAGRLCIATDGSRLVSGQSGVGEWQQRCLELVGETHKAAAVTHLGNLHELCESGKAWGSGGCGALLAPAIGSAAMVAIAEATAGQWATIQRTEPQLAAALTPVFVQEASPEIVGAILLEIATSWSPPEAKQHRGKTRKKHKQHKQQRMIRPPVEPAAIEAIERLHRRFPTEMANPGRSVQLLESLISRHAGVRPTRRVSRDPKRGSASVRAGLGGGTPHADEERGIGSTQDGDGSPPRPIDVAAVVDAFGRQTGLPRFLIDPDCRPELSAIEDQLGGQVIGQPEAISAVVDRVAIVAAGINRTDRPMASLMLIGPTGVGKTETAKALARLFYSDASRMVRLDLSEMTTAAAASRLIGGVPSVDRRGGNGSDDGGLLTGPVAAQPFSLVLLDEFEKAHPSVFDLLLQVLGEGRLTDAAGRVADFRNTIVLMTSNLGVDSYRDRPMGLGDGDADRAAEHFEKQVRRFVRPELFNRIDEILTYRPLPAAVVRQITRRRIETLAGREGLMTAGLSLSVQEALQTQIAADGYEPRFGARPIVRQVEKRLLAPLVEATAKHTNTSLIASIDGSGGVVIAANDVATAGDDRPGETMVKATEVRRAAGRLAACSATRQLQMSTTAAERALMRRFARACRPSARQAVLGSPEAEFIRGYYRQLAEIERLYAEAQRFEGLAVAASADGPPRQQIEALREEITAATFELIDQGAATHWVGLRLTGRPLSMAAPILTAYQNVARRRGWSLLVHALLIRPRDRDGKTCRQPVTCDAAGYETTAELSMWTQVPTSIVVRDGDPSPVVGLRLIDANRLANPPAGAAGFLMQFRGAAAGRLLRGERGVHTIRRLGDRREEGTSFWVDVLAEPADVYRVPAWLPKADFQLNGAPRRMIDPGQSLGLDLNLAAARPFPIDRAGDWLEDQLVADLNRRAEAMVSG